MNPKRKATKREKEKPATLRPIYSLPWMNHTTPPGSDYKTTVSQPLPTLLPVKLAVLFVPSARSPGCASISHISLFINGGTDREGFLEATQRFNLFEEIREGEEAWKRRQQVLGKCWFGIQDFQRCNLRYEKKHSNIPAHISLCFRVKEGDHVIIGQWRIFCSVGEKS